MSTQVPSWLPCCAGQHDPDLPDSFVIFGGLRFAPPFVCLCCGKVICGHQFAFGRCCGSCDVGACDSGSQAFRIGAVHEHPVWWRPSGTPWAEVAAALRNALPQVEAAP